MHALLQIFLFSTILSNAGSNPDIYRPEIAETITVDQSGQGEFTTVQSAIDSIPSGRTAWTIVKINAGRYNEKVTIPRDKQFIFLQGESARNTVIQWSDAGEPFQSTTLTVLAENFKARNIAFKNAYNEVLRRDGKPIERAPAAHIHADKASFYQCAFVSLQDTLSDSIGRHYFESCYIKGAIDFIWGRGQSIYQNCKINAIAAVLGGTPGYITAQGRESLESSDGYIFNGGSVVGTGSTYLGRAYREYSRVVFNGTDFLNIIVPEGWSAWDYTGHEEHITYAERKCTGPGSDMSRRDLSSCVVTMVVNVDDPELPSGVHVLLLIFLFSIIMSSAGSSPDIYRPKIAETITVDQSGHGEFTTVQKAIGSIQSGCTTWTIVKIKAGI
ncbi:hypothetical protein CRG98_003493 [Punica granatum]|uniref:pectinesterase n=1 Tax=Punica granatum TaxID=22663 RepID=A0A2I0L604_PUNGR|nr:hypothetical protein CRG98_003493 [Punica granatum]